MPAWECDRSVDCAFRSDTHRLVRCEPRVTGRHSVKGAWLLPLIVTSLAVSAVLVAIGVVLLAQGLHNHALVGITAALVFLVGGLAFMVFGGIGVVRRRRLRLMSKGPSRRH